MDFYDDLQRFKLKTQHEDISFTQFSSKNARGFKRSAHPIYKQLVASRAHSVNTSLAPLNFDELSTVSRVHADMPEFKSAAHHLDARHSVVIFDSVSKISAKRSAERLARQVHSVFSDNSLPTERVIDSSIADKALTGTV